MNPPSFLSFPHFFLGLFCKVLHLSEVLPYSASCMVCRRFLHILASVLISVIVGPLFGRNSHHGRISTGRIELCWGNLLSFPFLYVVSTCYSLYAVCLPINLLPFSSCPFRMKIYNRTNLLMARACQRPVNRTQATPSGR